MLRSPWSLLRRAAPSRPSPKWRRMLRERPTRHRPPFSLDAVHRLPDGRVRLELPRTGRSVTMSPEQCLGKLVALVPPRHFNLVRYAGRVRQPSSPAPADCAHSHVPGRRRFTAPSWALRHPGQATTSNRTGRATLGRPRANAPTFLVVAPRPRLWPRHQHHVVPFVWRSPSDHLHRDRFFPTYTDQAPTRSPLSFMVLVHRPGLLLRDKSRSHSAFESGRIAEAKSEAPQRARA